MDNLDMFALMGGAGESQQECATDWRWSMATDYPPKNGLKVFSCFSCGGGSTMGYKLAGCDVVGNCEIDPQMNEIYVVNHHPKYNYLMDMREFNALPVDGLPAELKELDILDGSPPCTTFSMAGLREETWGKEKRFREGQKLQTLDDLSFVFIGTAERLRPKVVIMENVEGLLNGNAFDYVRKIYAHFANAGYKLNHWLLKGEQMGVPQTRHRVFFVAVREDLDIDPHNLNMAFDYKPIPYGVIKSGQGKKVNPNTELYRNLLRVRPGENSFRDVYKHNGEKEKCYATKILWDENVMPTITAKFTALRVKEFEHVTEQDIISAQTFPADYNFVKRGITNVNYICGMSVPPIMIKRIMTKLIEQGVFDYKLKRGREEHDSPGNM